MAEANVNTTDLEIPQTMQLDMTPTPEPINPQENEPQPYKDDVRDAIAAKRRQMLENEMVAQGLEPQGTNKEEKQEPVQEPTPEEKAPAAVIPEETLTPEQQKDFILNVYGEEKKYPLEEVLKLAQKGAAANKVFEEGYRMKDEALQIANAIKQNLPQSNAAAKENPPQVSTPPVIDKEKAREIAKRINYGSEEDQINALLDLGASIKATVQGQAAQPALPPEQLVNIATQNAVAAIDARTEQETLTKEFSDIISDKALAAAADVIATDLAREYQKQGISKSRLELFREAGIQTRDKYLKPIEPPVQSQPPSSPKIVVDNDKLERKRAAPKPPAAANKIAIEPPPAYGVGVSSIVNQMRKARGQPILT